MSPTPLPSGDAARELALAHLFVTMPMRLDRPRRNERGQQTGQAVVGGVSADRKGWLIAWVAYLRTTAEAPTLSVWPAALGGVAFENVLPATAELELLARVDTPERAVARLSHHLKPMVQARINPDLEYLHRAIVSYRGDLRRERDRAKAWEEKLGDS